MKVIENTVTHTLPDCEEALIFTQKIKTLFYRMSLLIISNLDFIGNLFCLLSLKVPLQIMYH